MDQSKLARLLCRLGVHDMQVCQRGATFFIDICSRCNRREFRTR